MSGEKKGLFTKSIKAFFKYKIDLLFGTIILTLSNSILEFKIFSTTLSKKVFKRAF